jgi:glyoxylase-like metal-dependent hydrolase (beta-lactamase superfamily II)
MLIWTANHIERSLKCTSNMGSAAQSPSSTCPPQQHCNKDNNMHTSQLKTKVFISSDQHDGFGVSSTIVYGKEEALLVDCQFTLANAHRLVADIIETRCKLTSIVITHLHPDHFLGLSVVKHAFPDAKVIAYQKAADDVTNAYDFKIAYWGTEVLKENGSREKVEVQRVETKTLTLEGHKLEILGLMRGDCVDISPVWIPSIKTLIASDLVFSNCHVWVADARDMSMFEDWFKTLDYLESLGAEVVVPGHAPQGDKLRPASIGFTREYIKTFLKVFAQTKHSDALVREMDRIYPDYPVRICLDYSAKILKDKWKWEGDWPIELRNTVATL